MYRTDDSYTSICVRETAVAVVGFTGLKLCLSSGFARERFGAFLLLFAGESLRCFCNTGQARVFCFAQNQIPSRTLPHSTTRLIYEQYHFGESVLLSRLWCGVVCIVGAVHCWHRRVLHLLRVCNVYTYLGGLGSMR